MTREQYLNERKNLLGKSKELIDQGKVDEANEVMSNIEDLDKTFEVETTAVANFNALANSGSASPLLSNICNTDPIDIAPQTNLGEIKDGYATNEYREAFLNTLRSKQLTDNQSNCFTKVNASVEENSMLIPQQTANKIWEKVDELFPFYAKTTKTNVKGTFNLVQEDETSDAKFYDEETETNAGTAGTTEKFKTYQLSGCELSRSIDVSWKLKEMSMEDFENYIVAKMAKKMGSGAAHSSMTGKGKPGKEDTFKAEPNGVITALKTETLTPQVIIVDGAPTYANITNLISLVKGAYKKEMYATSDYIWNVLANILDLNGKPYFIADTTSGGVGRMFGITVQEDDSVPANSLLCGDATQYQINFNKQITLDTEDYKKKRITSYIGYAILDGAPITNKAFSLLEKKAVAEA